MTTFPFPPQREVNETFEWLTEVIRCKSAEQRIALRPIPRCIIDFDFHFLGNGDTEALTYLVKQFGETEFDLPLWQEFIRVGSISASQSNIVLNTTTSRYKDGGKAFIIDDDNTFEIVNITTVNPGSLDLTSPYNINSYSNAVIMPCYPAKLQGVFNIEKEPGERITGSGKFLITEDFNITSANSYPSFESSYVLTDRPLITNGSNETFEREVDIYDPKLGKVFYTESYTYPISKSNIAWAFNERSELFTFLKWIWGVKGKQKSFFKPRWVRDFIVVTDIISTDTTIEIENNSFYEPSYIGAICIVDTSGNLYFNRVTNVVDGVGDTRILSLNSQVGVSLTVSQIEMVTRMPKMRFDTDSFKINYKHGFNIDVYNMPVIEVPE